MASPAEVLAFLAKKTFVDENVKALLSKNSVGRSPVEAMRQTMFDIGCIKFGENTRPYRYLQHFLDKSGTDVRVDIHELMNQDTSVKKRIINEVNRRCLRINTVKEKRERGRSSSIYVQNIDPVITLLQSNFSNPEWMYALGTYDLRIEEIWTPSDPSGIVRIRLDSANIYRWYANQERFTQSIHQIGAALVSLGEARDFRMVAVNSIIHVDPKYARLLEMTTLRQTSPDNKHSIITPGAVLRGIAVHLGG